MSTYNDRIFNLVRTYRYNPTLFSEEQVDQLQELANQYDIPFKRKVDNFNLRKTVMNLQTGFLEGFTTIPVGKLSGHQPTTTYEAIAHSLGHLAGFAPGIMAAPFKAVGAKALSKLASKTNNWSVPMMFGDAAKAGMESGLKKKLFGKANIESLDFMRKGAAPRAIIDQAVHLGAASAVSSIWKGKDEIMNAGVQGAIAGGAFGGLGEFRMIGNYLKSKNPLDYKKGEQRLKSAIGAGMLGIPTALQGEPIEMVIYQTLLGGYFGYGSRPALEKEGGQFLQDLIFTNRKDYIFRPELHPEINSYSKGAKEYINKEATQYAKDYYLRNREKVSGDTRENIELEIENFVRQSKGLGPNEKPSKMDIDAEYRYRGNNFYNTYYAGKGYKYYIHKDVRDMLNSSDHRMDSMDDVNINVNISKDPKPGSSQERLLNTKKREKERNIFAVEEYFDINGRKQNRIIGPFSPKELGVKGDYYGKILGESRFDRPADKLENTEYILWDTVFINNAKPGAKANYEKQKPLDFKFNSDKRKTDAEKVFSWEKVFETDLRLDEKGFYIFGGIKDKSNFTIRKYHDEYRRYSKEELFEALAKENNITAAEISNRYETSRREFIKIYSHHKDIDLLNRMHEDAWKSNVLVEADRNGLYNGDLSRIHLLERPGFSKNVIDWNKREQIYHDKSMPLMDGTLNGGKFAIFKDVVAETYKNEKGEEKFYDSDTDGTIYFRQTDLSKMMDSLGLPKNVDMNKPVMVVKTPQGTMIVKAAGKSAPKELDAYMKKNNIKALIMDSAAKHKGLNKVNEFDRAALERGEWNHNGELFTGEFKDSDIRINLGTFVDPKKFGGNNKSRIVRQLLSNLNNKSAEGVMSIVWDRVFEPSINGNEKLNTAIKTHLKDKTDIKEIESFMKKNKLTVDEVGLDVIHDIFVNHGNSKLAQKFAREIARQDKKGELEDVDTFTPEEYKQYVYRNNRILDASNFSQSQREAGRNSRQFWESVYKKYFLNRLYSPKYDYSAKAWLSPKDPVTLLNASKNIKEGFFKLDDGHRNMKVIYKGEEMTLEKAWRKSGRNSNDPDLEMLVIRVPSDSMSGTRALKFAGFTRDKGYSITTNAKDNAYLGGADKDSDSAFIYQGMPRELHKATKGAANQWERGDVLLDSKRAKNDRLFGAQESAAEIYKTTTSKFSPSLRRNVAETAAKGNQGLGLGVIAKSNLTAIADYILANGGRLTNLPVYNKKGKQYATIEYIQLKPGGYDRLIELGREIVNRSADSSNYPTMVDYTKFPDILVKEAFNTKIRIKKTKGGTFLKDTSFSEIRGSKLGNITNVVRDIDPGKGSKKVSWTQLQNTVKNANIKGFDNFASFVGRKMQDMKITDSIFEEALFTRHSELVSNIGKYLETRQQIPDSVIKEINQLAVFKSNTGNILKQLEKGRNYEDIRYMLERDLEAVAGYVALTQKGYDLYKIIDSLPISKKSKAKFVDKYLKPIAEEASRIKRASYNNNPNKFGSKELTHSSSELFDREVVNYKYGKLALHANKLNNELKRLGIEIEWSKTNSMNQSGGTSKFQETLNDYFDLWLLSPFYTQSVNTQYSKFPWQSKSVSQGSIEYYTKTQDRIYDKLNTFKEGDQISKDIFKFEPEPSTPKEVIEKKVVEKFVPKDQAEYLKSRAVTDPELKLVEEFISRVNKNEIIRDNLEDFYINWQLQNKGGIDAKDLSLIDIKDINAINNYLKDADARFTAKGTKLPDYAFRASPEYMDLHMQNFENKFFAEMELPVRSRDGVVKRKVKRFTSTLGELKDFINKTNSQMESRLQSVIPYNAKRYPHLSFGEKNAEAINKLVVSFRESKNPNSNVKPGDYKLTSDYKRLSKETFPVKGEKKTLDQVIEITDRLMTEDFKQFGKKYIYANAKDKAKYIKFNADGSLDIKNIEKTIIKPMMKRENVTIPLDILREINYRMRNPKDVNLKKFDPIGERDVESYFPHINFGRNKKAQQEVAAFKEKHLKDFYDSKIAEGKSKKEAEELTKIEGFGIDTRVFQSQQDDKGLSSLNIFSSAKKRSAENMPGWDNTPNALNLYKEGFIRGMYRNMFKIQSDIRIQQFEKDLAFGNRTKEWSLYLREYANNSLGFASTFNKDVLENFIKADKNTSSILGVSTEPVMSKLFGPKFKRRGYYLTSDQKIIDTYDAVEKRFKKIGREVPFSKNIIPKPDASLKKTNPDLYKAQNEAHIQSLTRTIHKWGRMEAKYNLLTLLGHSKIMAGNLFGGTQMTISRGGLKNFTRVNSNKWLTDNIIKDPNGNYRLKLLDGTVVKDPKQLKKFLSENGVIESFITTELDVNADFANLKGVARQNMKDFAKELNQKLRKNPDMSEQSILDIARKYKVDKKIEGAAAWFMQTSERKLRKDSFLTHATEYMEHWGKYGLELSLNDPAVMEAGFRGVEATQFIYHSSFRPAFMRTALGKVFSRFKLFVFNSVRVRKEMLRKAKYYDFEPGTKEFEKFKTDFAINMFVMALGTAFAYSLFDTTLPPPYDWAQETGEWLFGNKKERDQAFFGQWPYPVAPLNIATPPVARIPMAAFSSLINKDWERFTDYHMYTMFPFGRLLRSVDKTYDEPYGTFEGRALQQFLGLPLDKVRSRIDRAKILEARQNMINSELNEMENII